MVASKHIAKRLLLLSGFLAILTPGLVLASDPVLELGQPSFQDGKVIVDVELRDFFNKNSMATLQSGVAATLVFQWTVRQHREGWHDSEVASGTVRNRIFFDVLEEQYHLFNHMGRPLGACDALSGVTQALCRREAMVLAGVGNLKNGVQYYVEMEASLEILNNEQVRGFEKWLLGEGDRGADSADMETEDALVSEVEDSGFSSSLSDLVLGAVLKITGISNNAVQGQSSLFWGET